MPPTPEQHAACDHDWRDIDGRWLCIECGAEKPYASDAANVHPPEPDSGWERAAATLTEREKLVALHNKWLQEARDAKDSERVVLNGCARELREALYGS